MFQIITLFYYKLARFNRGKIIMSEKKDNWKAFGKNTGKAFANFGKAIADTAKVVVGNDENKKEENGKTKLSNDWAKTGKGFGEAGKSLGTAIAETFKDDEKKQEETEVADEVVDDNNEVYK